MVGVIASISRFPDTQTCNCHYGKRLFLSAFVVLICFLGVTGIALDKAYRDSALTSHREALVGYLYAFLAASDVDENGLLNVANNLLERRFSLPGSGLYASVISSETSKTNLEIALIIRCRVT